MGRLFKEFTEEKWDQVRTHDYYAKVRADIVSLAESYMKIDPPRVRFRDIHLFVTTGNRTVFQEVYRNYEGRMRCFFLAYLLTKDEKYIEELADAIWNVCDFETWSLPAHVREDIPEERRKTFLDLTSTIMGYRVAEILYFVGDKLPDLVRSRAKYEVRKRVIDSYKVNDFFWKRTTNNWSAVCIGAILSAYLYSCEKEEIDEQLPAMLETIECYLSGFDDDGCCKEGYGYWNYGFSFFCLFASMLRDYTDGEIDLFKREKVHEIARFQQNMSMNELECISFSDGERGFSPSTWLSHFLKKEYPDIEIPSLKMNGNYGSAPLRYILWTDPELAESTMFPRNHIYHDNQWFINRQKDYTFACKAGCNAESHNHNDVGSFLISKNGKVTLVDIGGGEYTRQYFGPERYTILCNSSRGHSVPIINGNLQVTSKEKSVIYVEKEDEYSFSMQNAYSIETLKALTRTFKCDADGVSMTNQYDFTEKPTEIVERFVSMLPAEKVSEGVRVGDTVIVYDKSKFDLTFSTEGHTRSTNNVETVYIIDLKVKEPAVDTKVEIRFI